MAFIYVNVIVHGQRASKAVEMLADTGSTYITLDSKTIAELGLLETPYKVALTLLMVEGLRRGFSWRK
jgi:predicted aspartyl protease